MDFQLTEEQQMIKDMVRKFAEKEIRPKVADYYRDEYMPKDIIEKMAELNDQSSDQPIPPHLRASLHA